MQIPYEKLTEGFEALTLDAATFSHADHVGVAYVMLKKYDFLTATQRYAHNINTLATRVGAADKFNMTITVAFLSIIAERMVQDTFNDAEDFIRRNPDLLKRNPLLTLYSTERLQSEQARHTFLLPDRAA